MVGGNGKGLLGGGGDEGAPGQMISFAKEAAGTLLDGGNGRLLKGIGFEAGQDQMMSQVVGHFLTVNALEMRAGEDSGNQGMGSTENKLIDQGALTGQYDGQVGLESG